MLSTIFSYVCGLFYFCGYHIYSTETLTYTYQDTYLMNFMTFLLLFPFFPNLLFSFILYSMCVRYHTNTFTTESLIADLLALLCALNGYNYSMLFLIYDLKKMINSALRDHFDFNFVDFFSIEYSDKLLLFAVCINFIYIFFNSVFVGILASIIFVLNQCEHTFKRIIQI